MQALELPESIVERVVFLVSHHHTLTGIDGLDYQILLEADYLVNADESRYSPDNIQNAMHSLFRTPSGRTLLKAVYSLA